MILLFKIENYDGITLWHTISKLRCLSSTKNTVEYFVLQVQHFCNLKTIVLKSKCLSMS